MRRACLNLFLAMTKEEFVSRLATQLNGVAKFTKANAEKEIRGRRSRMDTEGFNEWLREEQRAALATPHLFSFDLVTAASMESPDKAAENLAAYISFDCDGVVDWLEQWEKAAPIITGSTVIWPEASAHWKYKHAFSQYYFALKADVRARVFSAHIAQVLPKGFDWGKYKDEETALQFRQEVMRREDAYFALWDECKDILGNANLPEREFILSDIDFCEEGIEHWKDKSHSFKSSWVGILKANIRAHRERLEALEAGTAKDGAAPPPTEAKPLPTLEEVVKDAETFLPKLWNALATEPKPLVGRAGNINADAAKPSVLMALAQALLTEQKIDGKKYAQVDVYRMLCRHFGIKGANRPRIKARTETGLTNTYSDILIEFNDLLKDL